MIARLAALLGCLLITACGCNADLTIRITPTSQQLRIGEQFTPTISYRGCSDTRPLSDVVRWSSSDTTVAVTDAGTGRTMARAVGLATITAVGTTYRQAVPIPLTVIP